MSDPTSYLLERAWVDGAVHDDVLVEIEDGRFTSVTPATGSLACRALQPPTERRDSRSTGDPDATRLPGLTIPGLANCHSHAFHRALRGRTQRGRGTFWTWREQMYAVAERLDPDSYLALATVTFREMVAAGITAWGSSTTCTTGPTARRTTTRTRWATPCSRRPGRPGCGSRCSTPATSRPGSGEPVEGVQRRFSDGDVDGWGARVAALEPTDGARIGAAYHSVRAVPARPDAAPTRLAAAHPPLRAGRGERAVPGGVRPHPDPGLRRGRPPRPTGTRWSTRPT